MLSFIEFSKLSDKKKFVNHFFANQSDFEKDQSLTWIVSDLKSKLNLQELHLEKFGFCLDQNVYRISEFWKKLCLENEVFHNVKWVSREGAQVFVDHFIAENHPELKSQSSKVFKFLQSWISVLMKPDGPDLILEWAAENPENSKRWLHLFELSQEVFNFLKNQNIICDGWRPELIMSAVESQNFELKCSTKNLIIDVGIELKQTEMELLTLLAKNSEVKILCPEIKKWQPVAPYLFKTLELVHSPKISTLMRQDRNLNIEIEISKYNNPLAELKDLGIKISKLMSNGVQPSEISIVALDPNELRNLLVETMGPLGVPLDFEKKGSLMHFSQTQNWLSQLRIALKENSNSTEFSDVISYVFSGSGDSRQSRKYNEIYHLLYNLIDPSDISKHLKMNSQTESSKNFSAAQFIFWALNLLHDFDSLPIEKIIKDLLAKAPLDLHLPKETWMNFLENVLSGIEVSLNTDSNKAVEGVSLVGLMSAESDLRNYQFFVQCSQEAIEGSASHLLQAKEVDQISKDLGFYLPHPESHVSEFELQWLLSNESSQLSLSFAELSFSGQLQSVPRSLTNFNLAIKTNSESSLSKKEWNFLKPELQKNDFSEIKFDHFSAHSVSEYLKCPFITLAKRGWKLEDPQALDLKPDPMKSGIMTHRLFELIIKEGVPNKTDTKRLKTWIEEIFLEQKPVWLDPSSDLQLKNKLLNLGTKFWEFENQKRIEFPNTTTWGTEVSFSVQLPTGEIFKGVIDRIDTDHLGNIVIYDYKNKTSSYPSPKSLESSSELQLWIYAWLVEKMKAIPGLPGTVVGIFYYNTQTLECEKGFRLKDFEQGLFSLNDRKLDKMNLEIRDQHFQTIEHKITTAISGMKSHEFNPKPNKESDCGYCSWKFHCHAPHLAEPEGQYEI